MPLPQHLLVDGDLCKLTVSPPTGAFAASAAYNEPPDFKVIAEWAGHPLVGYGITEETARQNLEALCTRLDLIHSAWYAKR